MRELINQDARLIVPLSQTMTKPGEDDCDWLFDDSTQPLSELAHVGIDDLTKWVDRFGGNVTVRVSLSSIGMTQNPIDISHDYLQAILVGERLMPFCYEQGISSHQVSDSNQVDFRMRVLQRQEWATEILWLARGFELEQPEDVEVASFTDELSDKVYESSTAFPDLGDSCLANLVNGCFSDYPGWRPKLLRKYPAWRYRYWRSCWSARLGYELLVSDVAWIAPANADLKEALRHVGGIDLDRVRLTRLAPIFLGDGDWFMCGEGAVFRTDRFVDTRTRQLLKRLYGPLPHPLQLEWQMVSDGNVVIGRGDRFSFVMFFDNKRQRISTKTAAVIRDTLTSQLAALDSAIEPASPMRIDWHACDPERFEEICRELLCRSGRFNADTARLFGKAQSRDGGRDIEIWTPSRPGRPPQKWIFQCKRYAPGRALSASMVHVSDVIDQYAAQGFGIMTTTTIDATLWDRLDLIGSRRGVEIDCWDAQRLARAVIHHPDLLWMIRPETASTIE